MIFLLSLKERFKKFYNRYNMYVLPAVKFVLALVTILLLNMSIGHMGILKNPVIVLGASVVSAFLPIGFMVVVLTLFMLGHLYAVSVEFAAIALCVVALMYLLYFRFTPNQGYVLILTVILCCIKLPYMLPIALGLSVGISSIIPVSFGVIIYYIISTASAYDAAITNQASTDSFKQISFIAETFVGNRAWIVLVLAFAVAIAVTYFIKKLTVDNAWTYAIVAGTAIQFLFLIAGKIVFNANISMINMIIGTLIGAVLAYVCRVIFFSLDYKRTEYVQYEDDEYYYYVKAVPKVNIANASLQVKHINRKNTKRTSDINSMNRRSQRSSMDRDRFEDSQEEDDIFI